jgi:predicted dehydrogenase
MRIGLVGAGFIGRTHVRVAVQVPQVKMVGYVDPLAKADHPDLAGLTRYDTLAAMLDDGVEGVVVAVPDDLHVPMATQCLEHGAAVLLEKPAARSLAECAALSKAPEVSSRLLVGHQRRHHPASRVAKELIETGELGRLVGVGGVFAVKKDDKYFVERPRGVGLVNLIHDLDLLQFFCGPITQVSAAVSHQGRGAREEDTIALTMEFASGVIGSFIATDSAPSPWGWDQGTIELPSIPFHESGTTYSLLGTSASLSVPDLNLYRHKPGEAWHHPLVHRKLAAAGADAYVNQMKHFAEIVAGRAQPIVGIAEALATQAALEAIFISAREGRRVSIAALVDAARGS